MLFRFFASWLVVLVLVPFTAPFSICDLPSLLGNAQSAHSPGATRSSVASNTDTAVPTAHFVANAGRVRLLPLCRVPLAESATPSSTAAVMWTAASTVCSRQYTTLSTILRV